MNNTCDICKQPKELTPDGLLHPLAVRGIRGRTYLHQICEQCVRMFNSAGWAQTRQALNALRTQRDRRALDKWQANR